MSKLDVRRDAEKIIKNKLSRKNRSDAKLKELEKELEFAESRCGTLKQQLDYIKQLYGCKKVVERKISREERRGDGDGDGSLVGVGHFTYNDFSKWKGDNFPNGENGDGPDFAREASHSTTISTNPSNKPVQETKKKSPKGKTHVKMLKFKKKTSRKVKKKRRLDDGTSSKLSNASSQTQTWQDPVVEIYKNLATNVESEMGFEVFGKNKPFEVLKSKLSNNYEVIVETKAKSCNSLNKKGTNFQKEEGMQTEFPFPEVKQPEVDGKESGKVENVLGEPLRSYCQPTISSKKKQVERDIYSNLANLNIRNIPFIVAKSTAPSHNIGVNIQQVLSIIKKRQPLSETGNQENPLTSLLSTRKIASKNSERLENAVETPSETKKKPSGPRTSLSHWKSSPEMEKEKSEETKSEEENADWSFKVDKLKKVLLFLHEDFTSLSQKYKRLQKKLTKRNITKREAKDELAQIEKDLEKKEEEITVVIALYKEVLNVREEMKKLQERCGRNFIMDGIKQSSSAHFQMTALLRKIQNFQDKLKG